MAAPSSMLFCSRMALAKGQASRRSPEEVQQTIEAFLSASAQPVLLEPGGERVALRRDNYNLSIESGWLFLHVWNATASVRRRVLTITAEKLGRLDLTVERFAKQTGVLTLVDLDRPKQRHLSRKSGMAGYREYFRRMLARHYPDWKVAELSIEPDLEHSLSPSYARALLRRGNTAWAALGIPFDAAQPQAGLTFGLIWLDYLRNREQRFAVQGLVLFVPASHADMTRLRLAHLNHNVACFAAFGCVENGAEEPIDVLDRGNVETVLEDRRLWEQPAGEGFRWVAESQTLPEVETVLLPHSVVSLRVSGMEIARWEKQTFLVGLEAGSEVPNPVEAVRQLSNEVRLRRQNGADPTHPLYKRYPERWLESAIRRQLSSLDATLLPEPVYGQVLTIAGREAGLLDLLAIDRNGRLAIIEVKASEDIHLPLQALDYWIRISWHLQRGELSQYGYFPGRPLSSEMPRCLLVSPALHFHPATETILRYVSPEVDVERIGIAAHWRRELQVAFRLSGAGRPQCQIEESGSR